MSASLTNIIIFRILSSGLSNKVDYRELSKLLSRSAPASTTQSLLVNFEVRDWFLNSFVVWQIRFLNIFSCFSGISFEWENGTCWHCGGGSRIFVTHCLVTLCLVTHYLVTHFFVTYWHVILCLVTLFLVTLPFHPELPNDRPRQKMKLCVQENVSSFLSMLLYFQGFIAELSASGSFCTRHVKLPIISCFYRLSDDDAPSPYMVTQP